MQGMHSNHGNELEDFDNAGYLFFLVVNVPLIGLFTCTKVMRYFVADGLYFLKFRFGLLKVVANTSHQQTWYFDKRQAGALAEKHVLC